jgi:hypothetical protein
MVFVLKIERKLDLKIENGNFIKNSCKDKLFCNNFSLFHFLNDL